VGHRRADVSNPIDPNGISVSTDSLFDGSVANIRSDSIAIEIAGTVSGQVNMSGTFACIRNDGSECKGQNTVDKTLIILTKSSGGACSITGSGNISNIGWECKGLPTSGSSNFTSNAVYKFSSSDRASAVKPLFLQASGWTNGDPILIVIP
jgi:hypothetical protein